MWLLVFLVGWLIFFVVGVGFVSMLLMILLVCVFCGSGGGFEKGPRLVVRVCNFPWLPFFLHAEGTKQLLLQCATDIWTLTNYQGGEILVEVKQLEGVHDHWRLVIM